jgi:hypothetical protein
MGWSEGHNLSELVRSVYIDYSINDFTIYLSITCM